MARAAATEILAVGDVCFDRTNPDSIFDLIREDTRKADMAFCQIETPYSTRGSPNPSARVPFRAAPANIGGIARAGFNVASFASNHTMSWGPDAMLDTVDNLRTHGLHTIGAGRNLAEARKPAILESNGSRIGWLAYCSVLLPNSWAQSEKPGCAPARAHTLYEPIERDQPGTPARILSFPHEGDLEAMRSDIRRLKEEADVVIVSMHWGIHYKEAELAAYQRAYGHSAIDAGADVIIGHHAHILKPVEVYHGKVIFYSLCNFAFDLFFPEDEWTNPERLERLAGLNPSWKPDARYKSYPFPADSRKSMMARITVADKRVSRVSCVPLIINETSQPRVVRHAEREFGDVLDYLTRITRHQKLDTEFEVSGDEFVLTGG